MARSSGRNNGGKRNSDDDTSAQMANWWIPSDSKIRSKVVALCAEGDDAIFALYTNENAARYEHDLALRALIYRYTPRLLHFLRLKWTQTPPCEMEWILNETYIRLIDSVQNGKFVYTCGHALGSWLIRTTHLITLEWYRSEYTESLSGQCLPHLSLDDLDESQLQMDGLQLSNDHEDADNLPMIPDLFRESIRETRIKSNLERLWRIIETVSRSDTLADTAKSLDVSPGSVRVLLMRLRNKLQRSPMLVDWAVRNGYLKRGQEPDD